FGIMKVISLEGYVPSLVHPRRGKARAGAVAPAAFNRSRRENTFIVLPTIVGVVAFPSAFSQAYPVLKQWKPLCWGWPLLTEQSRHGKGPRRAENHPPERARARADAETHARARRGAKPLRASTLSMRRPSRSITS